MADEKPNVVKAGPDSQGADPGDLQKVYAVDKESGKAIDEAAVAKRLAENFPSDEDADLRTEETPEAPKDEKSPTPPPSDQTDTATSDSPPVPEPKSETSPQDSDTKTGDEPTPAALDPVTVRALKRQGYSDDDIAEQLKEDPKSFGMLAKYIQRQAQAQDLAALQQAQQKQPFPPTAPVPQQAPVPAVTGQQLTPADLTALRNHYKRADGQPEPVIEALIAQAQQFQSLVPEIQAMRQDAQRARDESLRKMIDDTFAAPENAAVHEVMGKKRDALTPEQLAARNDVLRNADGLHYAARGGISHAEALQRAIDLHTAQNAKTSARAAITEELKKRQAGATLKPKATTSAGKPSEAKPSNAQELRNKVRGLLKKTFGG